METLKLRLKRASERGSTLVEALIAVMVLSVGLVALGSLAAQTMTGTSRSRFISLAADLATEKLEDLSRWPTFDGTKVVLSPSVRRTATRCLVLGPKKP